MPLKRVLNWRRTMETPNSDLRSAADEYLVRYGGDTFDSLFAAEAAALGHEVRGSEVLELLSGDLRPAMVHALDKIRKTLKTTAFSASSSKACCSSAMPNSRCGRACGSHRIALTSGAHS